MSSHTTFGVYARGMAMGAADVVPGVSGGTIALITGIYQQLLASLCRFDRHSASLLLGGKARETWQYVDGRFLLVLVAGILTSIFLLAGLISHWLETQPLLIWSFFTGLIAASGIYLLVGIERWYSAMVFLFLGGVAIAIWIATARPVVPEPSLLYFFGCGAIAICAMVLPGISGSFILVLLGAYAPVMQAIRDFELSLLVVFATGCGLGLLSFVHLLNWLLS